MHLHQQLAIKKGRLVNQNTAKRRVSNRTSIKKGKDKIRQIMAILLNIKKVKIS